MPVSLDQIESALAIDYTAATLQTIEHPLLDKHNVSLSVKRDDQLHPVISGNKWRKLKYCLQDAFEKGHDHLISMGGAWSNHLHALAYVGYQLNIKTTGLIRGESNKFESPTLQDLQNWGMQIEFVDRETFRRLRSYHHHNDKPAQQYKGYWLPEGGASLHALRGVNELKQEIIENADIIAVACGTGTTLAGLLPTANDKHQVLGIAALQGESFLEKEISRLMNEALHNGNYHINYDYHFGGFAKQNPELIEFIHGFEQQTSIPLEPVYTGKLFYGLFDLIEKEYFPTGSHIVAIHSGGLQGKREAMINETRTE